MLSRDFTVGLLTGASFGLAIWLSLEPPDPTKSVMICL